MKKIFYSTYISTLILFLIFSYTFVDPNLFYFHQIYTNIAFSHRGITTGVYLVFICLFFVYYISFQKILKSKREVLMLIGVTCGILLFAYPAMLSYDIFNYIATAKVTFFYKENPYIIMPIDIPNDSILRFLHAGNKTALYGPVWIIITLIPLVLGMGNFFLTVVQFKFIAILGYLGICWMIWRLSKDLKTILLFAFNPLIVIELCVSGHNDGIMIFFALTSIYFLKNRKIFRSIVLLFASMGIKYATIFLIPAYFFVLSLMVMNRPLQWKKIFLYFAISMLVIFSFSPLREEMYPWYAIWFLPFIYLSGNRLLSWISHGLSVGLMFRYIPFIYLGTYFGPTPMLKIVLTSVPFICSLIAYIIRYKGNNYFKSQKSNVKFKC